MAGPFELKKLWTKYRPNRIAKKQRSSQASSESSSRDSKGSMALDEANVMMVGLGIDTKQEEGYIDYGYIEHALDDDDVDVDDDPRFINNPHGIGCSKTYEELSYDGSTNSFSSSPASTRPLVPREIDINESDELPSFPKLGAWKMESIDMVKGKRKGRMPGDSADDRFKFLLDGPASRAKSSAKRFTLVRERVRTR